MTSTYFHVFDFLNQPVIRHRAIIPNLQRVLILIPFILIFACGSASKDRGQAIRPATVEKAASQPKVSKVSYVVRGKRYHILASARGYDETGLATWYGGKFHGRKTANGEKFNTRKLTAAHKTLPFNTMVEVTNLSNNRTVIVRINDRGPFSDKHVIDLSRAAADAIGMTHVTKVRVTAVEKENPALITALKQ
ncbi:hypothetical protein C4J81_07145 [Deltaproteobacteria bacterium Smac51]|nr:hypothetical protein C4J81_07145 [Deltaproteobacteria bacterium Smac51]